MAYTITREALRGQLRDEIRYCATAGAGSDAELNRRLAREVKRVWERMMATAQGVGQRTLSKTITTSDPDGYVPGERVPLPEDFRRLLLLKVDKAEPRESTAQEVESLAIVAAPAPGNMPLLFYWDGPRQDQSGPSPVMTEQTIRLYPNWRAGQTLLMFYVVQPPTLGDASDPADDGIALDLIHEPVARYVVARACVRAVSREDQQGYQRAIQEQVEAEDEFVRALARRSGAPPPLSAYRHRGRR